MYVFQDKYGENFSDCLRLSASIAAAIIYSLNRYGNTHTHMRKYTYIANCLRLHLPVRREKKETHVME
jgi:hypothetical protein